MKKSVRIVLGAVLGLGAAAGLAALVILYLIPRYIQPAVRYKQADYLYSLGRYDQAMDAFRELGDYRDSRARIEAYETSLLDGAYGEAQALYDAGRYEEAIPAFEALKGYRDSEERVEACRTAILDRAYNEAMALYEAGQYDEAANAFVALGDYRDSADQALGSRYDGAMALYEAGRYDEAAAAFVALGSYRDSADQAEECGLMERYADALALYEAQRYEEALDAFAALGSYRDSAQMAEACAGGYLTLAQEALGAGDVSKAVEHMGRVDAARLTLKQQLQLQKLYTACGKALEDRGDYAAAFQLYASTGDSAFEKDMARCNEKYRTEPRRLSEQCENVDALYWQYGSRQITLTVRYSTQRDASCYFTIQYVDGTYKRRDARLSKNLSELTFRFPYSEVSDPAKVRGFVLYLGFPNKAYQDVFLSDTFANADKDLYGKAMR